MVDLKLHDRELLKQLVEESIKYMFKGENIRTQPNYQIRGGNSVDFIVTTGYQSFGVEDRIEKTLQEIKAGKIDFNDMESIAKAFTKYKSWYKLDKVYLFTVKSEPIIKDDILGLLETLYQYRLEDDSRKTWELGTLRGILMGYQIEEDALRLLKTIGFLEFRQLKTFATLEITVDPEWSCLAQEQLREPVTLNEEQIHVIAESLKQVG